MGDLIAVTARRFHNYLAPRANSFHHYLLLTLFSYVSDGLISNTCCSGLSRAYWILGPNASCTSRRRLRLANTRSSSASSPARAPRAMPRFVPRPPPPAPPAPPAPPPPPLVMGGSGVGVGVGVGSSAGEPAWESAYVPGEPAWESAHPPGEPADPPGEPAYSQAGRCSG